MFYGLRGLCINSQKFLVVFINHDTPDTIGNGGIWSVVVIAGCYGSPWQCDGLAVHVLIAFHKAITWCLMWFFEYLLYDTIVCLVLLVMTTMLLRLRLYIDYKMVCPSINMSWLTWIGGMPLHVYDQMCEISIVFGVLMNYSSRIASLGFRWTTVQGQRQI